MAKYCITFIVPKDIFQVRTQAVSIIQGFNDKFLGNRSDALLEVTAPFLGQTYVIKKGIFQENLFDYSIDT